MQNICVYCASSSQVKEEYYAAAAELGRLIAGDGLRLVYGGGQRGLMGKIADTVMELNGTVTGIMPRFMTEVEWNHTGITEMILVDSMHERKEKMAAMADAVVALPGGCGTMEELLEVITWKRLGIFTHPIIICNTGGYFDPLIEMLNQSVDENFMREEHRRMWQVAATPAEVMQLLKNPIGWDPDARTFAAL